MAQQTVSFGNFGGDPQVIQQQLELQRQMQIADMLKKQSMESLGPTEMVSGIAVKKSPLEGLAKIAQALVGQNMQADADAKTAQIAAGQQQKLADALRVFSGSDTPSDVSTGSAQPAQASAQPASNPQTSRLAAALTIQSINPELGGKILGDMLTDESTVKKWRSMGIDPRTMAKYEFAKAQKEGMYEIQPGAKTKNLVTGESDFVPKVGEGITLNPDGSASGVPNYAQAAAGITGANAQATEQAKAQNELVDVNTPQGPVKMTKAQAIQMAGGQAPQQPGVNFKNPNGASLRFDGLTPQQTFDQLQQLKNVDPALYQQAMQSFGQYSQQPAAQNGPGIQLQDEGAKAAEIKRGEFFGTNYADLQKGAMTANTKIASLDRFASLMDGVNTGKLTPRGTELAAYAQSMGFNIDKNLGNKQAAAAISNQLALDLRNPSGGAGMPGAMSDADRNYLSQMVPSLGDTPEAIRLKIEFAKRLAQRDQEIAALARNYKGGNLDNGFYTVVQQYANANPMFANQKQGQTQPQAPSGWSIKRVQ